MLPVLLRLRRSGTLLPYHSMLIAAHKASLAYRRGKTGPILHMKNGIFGNQDPNGLWCKI